MSRQLLPTEVLKDCDVPRLIVEYSLTTVPSPISTVVGSTAYFRSCGGPPITLPTPIFTRAARRTSRSSVARGAITQSSPTSHPSPMMANGPTSTRDPSNAFEDATPPGCNPG